MTNQEVLDRICYESTSALKRVRSWFIAFLKIQQVFIKHLCVRSMDYATSLARLYNNSSKLQAIFVRSSFRLSLRVDTFPFVMNLDLNPPLVYLRIRIISIRPQILSSLSSLYLLIPFWWLISWYWKCRNVIFYLTKSKRYKPYNNCMQWFRLLDFTFLEF